MIEMKPTSSQLRRCFILIFPRHTAKQSLLFKSCLTNCRTCFICQHEIIHGYSKTDAQKNFETHSRNWRYLSKSFQNGNKQICFKTSFNSFNFHKGSTLMVMIALLLSSGEFQNSCIFVCHADFFSLQIRSTLTDNNNVYSQLHSLLFSFLQELMQNSQCVLSKWKNKYVCQVKWLDMLMQCLTSGAENYAVIGILCYYR